MVMIFRSEKALKHLLEKGEVDTYRKNKRKKLGKNWITDRRGNSKIASVEIQLIGEVEWPGVVKKYSVYPIKEFLKYSGFSSLDEWKEEIRRLNGGEVPFGYLYRVKLLEEMIPCCMCKKDLRYRYHPVRRMFFFRNHVRLCDVHMWRLVQQVGELLKEDWF